MSVEWTPPDWMYRETRPPYDAAYFENLTHCIFQAGLNWKVIAQKWPSFKKAFNDFDIGTVASYGAEDIGRLVEDKGIVRNRNKILATIHNAREFERIAAEHGSFRGWLDGIDKSGNYEVVVRRLIDLFKHVGKSTAHIFLYTVGEDIKYDESVLGRRSRRD